MLMPRFARSFENLSSWLRRNRIWLIAIIAVAALQGSWSQITRTRGAQKVAFAPSFSTCGGRGDLRYCIYRAAGGTSDDVLYHLHGRNLDEQVWNDETYFTAQVQAEWQRSGVKPPTVVSVSYGSTWLLAPRGRQSASGKLETFMDDIQAIERITGTPARRLLLGESMGGLNVLVAGLRHPQRFAKLAALCPGVYVDSPFSSFSTLREAARRTGANPKLAFAVWRLARSHVANQSEWQAFSPLHLVETADETYPELYLSNGLYDAFGNFEGTQELARMARERGVSTRWHPLYGGHCSIDVVSLAAFLTEAR